MSGDMKVPSVSRSLVESLVRASTGGVAEARTVLDAVDAAPGVAWRTVGVLGSVAGVDELRTAIRGIDGLDGARRARIDAVLALATGGPTVTVPVAAKSLGVAATNGAVQDALQARGFDLVLEPGRARYVQRVPASFLEHRNVRALASSAVLGGGSTGTAVGSGGSAIDRLRSGLGAIQARAAALPPKARIGGAVATALAAAGLVGAAVLRGKGESTAPVGAGAIDAAAAAEEVSNADKARAKVVQTAFDLRGTPDVNPDGSLNETVRAMKAGVDGGDPDDPNKSWHVAFVTHVMREAGMPIGANGRGAQTAIDLRVWAEQNGRFRPVDHDGGPVPGNAVLLERTDARGLTWHDVGIIVPGKDGSKGLFVIAGNRMTGESVTIDGKKVGTAAVGSVTEKGALVPLDATLERDGMRIEGYIDMVSAPLPVAAPPPPDPTQLEAKHRGELVARAVSKLNVVEDAGRANRGPEVDEFWRSAGDVALNDADRLWCAAFTSWVYNEQRMPYFDRDGSISTPQIRQWAIDNGVWHKRSEGYEPKPGDLIGFKSARNDATLNHIGIVESFDRATGMVTTIEGNTGGGQQETNGGAVLRKQHHRDDPYIRGYVNVFEYYAKDPDGPGN